MPETWMITQTVFLQLLRLGRPNNRKVQDKSGLHPKSQQVCKGYTVQPIYEQEHLEFVSKKSCTPKVMVHFMCVCLQGILVATNMCICGLHYTVVYSLWKGLVAQEWKGGEWQRTDGGGRPHVHSTGQTSALTLSRNFLYKTISFIETRLVCGKLCPSLSIFTRKMYFTW